MCEADQQRDRQVHKETDNETGTQRETLVNRMTDRSTQKLTERQVNKERKRTTERQIGDHMDGRYSPVVPFRGDR